MLLTIPFNFYHPVQLLMEYAHIGIGNIQIYVFIGFNFTYPFSNLRARKKGNDEDAKNF